jgi:hypothetical protein
MQPRRMSVWKLGVIAVFMAILSMSQAFAADEKIYPGEMCIRAWGGIPYLDAASLFNAGTDMMHVDCPLVRDNTTGGFSSGYVKIVDLNPGTDVKCSLQIAYRGGDGVMYWYAVQATGQQYAVSFGPQNLSVGGFSFTSQTHYFYSCNIPPVSSYGRSGIVSYHLNEN